MKLRSCSVKTAPGALMENCARQMEALASTVPDNDDELPYNSLLDETAIETEVCNVATYLWKTMATNVHRKKNGDRQYQRGFGCVVHVRQHACYLVPFALCLSWLLAGDASARRLVGGEKSSLSLESAWHHILSIGQDLIHCCSRGRIKTPNEALPIAIKNWTGSPKIENVLNRFGHCLSVSQASEVETRSAMTILNRHSHLPNSIVPGKCTTLCTDNNNILE